MQNSLIKKGKWFLYDTKEYKMLQNSFTTKVVGRLAMNGLVMDLTEFYNVFEPLLKLMVKS
jgi:hypothetical protein